MNRRDFIATVATAATAATLSMMGSKAVLAVGNGSIGPVAMTPALTFAELSRQRIIEAHRSLGEEFPARCWGDP